MTTGCTNRWPNTAGKGWRRRTSPGSGPPQPIAEQGKQALAVESLTVVADTGYSNGEHGERCEQAQITAIVPRAQTVNPEGKQYFSRDRFSYDTQTDSYQCPAGAMLSVGKVSYTQAKKEYW